jgi:hypothetical protein
MSRPLPTSRAERTPGNEVSLGSSYRLVWACLPLMLILSGAVLLLFGVSWGTAFVVILLLSCPASMALATYLGFSPSARL